MRPGGFRVKGQDQGGMDARIEGLCRNTRIGSTREDLYGSKDVVSGGHMQVGPGCVRLLGGSTTVTSGRFLSA